MLSKKKILTSRLRAGLLGLLGLLVLLSGCQTPVYVSEAPSELVKFRKILFVPFSDATKISGHATDTRCPVCGRVFVTGEVAEGAADFLSNKSVTWLKDYTAYQLVIDRRPTSSTASLPSVDQAAGNARKTLVDKGREKDADVVLTGYVYRFRERVGKGYSAESPASVAFGMHLIRVTDGGTIWSAHFDETQQSLGENLFQLGTFISRGGRWVTTEELALSGLKKILEKFPKS